MEDLLAQYLFHWTPERAVWLGGKTLTWDARCAGIYAGFCTALLLHLLFYRNQSRLPSRPALAAAAVLILPLFIDVFTIHFQLRQPINGLRHLTGLLFGISFCSVLYPAARQLLGADQSLSGERLTLRRMAVLALAGIGISLFSQWDRLFSYYLLESLSWGGFIGLATLVAAGLAGSLLKRS